MTTLCKSITTAVLTVGATVALAACTIEHPERNSSTFSETSSSPSSSSQTPSPQPEESVKAQEFLIPDGAVAIVTAAGQDEAGAVDVPAWSTIKVPVAIAALRNNSAEPQQITAAITQSSNTDAEQLWKGLGEPAEAGHKVEQVLREGDSLTAVNTQPVRPEFSTFGQTDWKLADQARFAGHLQCMSGAESVVDAMGNVAAEQSYGLGHIPGARFKGGWGPDESGQYQVRQFGLLPVEGGFVGVALAVSPPDGSYESGQAMLNDMAKKIQPALALMKPVFC